MVFALRVNVLCKGCSGIRRETAERMIAAFNKNCIPLIPSQGTVGASGDLVPLSHIALGLMGEGQMWDDSVNQYKPASEVLKVGLSFFHPFHHYHQTFLVKAIASYRASTEGGPRPDQRHAVHHCACDGRSCARGASVGVRGCDHSAVDEGAAGVRRVPGPARAPVPAAPRTGRGRCTHEAGHG